MTGPPARHQACRWRSGLRLGNALGCGEDVTALAEALEKQTRFPDLFMSESTLKILAVVGSTNADSITRVVVTAIAEDLIRMGCDVDLLDLGQEPLALFNPETAARQKGFATLKARVDQADVFVLGTPDYHGSMSGALKNFFDHFWQEFTGKLFATVVASHEKGLTVTDQLRTVARQCYAWSLPYGVAFADKQHVANGQIVNDAFKSRLAMFVRDTKVYGELLAAQRHADFAGTDTGFMARLRK